MADKFNLDGFSVSSNNTITSSGGLTGGVDKDLTISADKNLVLAGLEKIILAASGTVEIVPALPATDPGASGQLWADSSAGYVIKVSQG